jgi:hypothetical protein
VKLILEDKEEATEQYFSTDKATTFSNSSAVASGETNTKWSVISV